MENGDGHPVTKSELQAILLTALTAQREDFHGALTAQGNEFLGALTAQREDFHGALTAQGNEFLAALTAQREDFHGALTAQGNEFLAALTAQGNEFHAALTAQGNEFHAALAAQKDELMEKMRDIETNLLTSFHGYARGIQARMHGLESGTVDVNVRLAAIEDRLLALEARRPPSV